MSPPAASYNSTWPGGTSEAIGSTINGGSGAFNSLACASSSITGLWNVPLNPYRKVTNKDTSSNCSLKSLRNIIIKCIRQQSS